MEYGKATLKISIKYKLQYQAGEQSTYKEKFKIQWGELGGGGGKRELGFFGRATDRWGNPKITDDLCDENHMAAQWEIKPTP